MLEQKKVILSTTFYRYIFLVYHLVLLILIVSYDVLDMDSTFLCIDSIFEGIVNTLIPPIINKD